MIAIINFGKDKWNCKRLLEVTTNSIYGAPNIQYMVIFYQDFDSFDVIQQIVYLEY